MIQEIKIINLLLDVLLRSSVGQKGNVFPHSFIMEM